MQPTSTFQFLTERPPFSKREVDRLGHYYARMRDDPPGASAQILEWYASLAEQMRLAATTVIRRALPAHQEARISSSRRVKSQDTIEPKIRNKNIQLSRMQDFAGVRFTLDCHHSELTHVGETIMEDVRLTGCQAEMRQYLESSQQGYRAVHVWISSPAGRVEIQLRTQLQNDWANTFEYLSDLAGRQIRYDSTYTPDDPLLERIAESMGQLSDRIYNLEAHSGAPLPHDLFDERLAIHDALNEHRIALNNYRKNLAGGGRKP